VRLIHSTEIDSPELGLIDWSVSLLQDAAVAGAAAGHHQENIQREFFP
jgi:hypothetical protein